MRISQHWDLSTADRFPISHIPSRKFTDSFHVFEFGTYWLVKGKVIQLQARGGPEGSRKLRFPDFMTTAQAGGKVVSLTQRPPLSPGNTPGTHFC